MCFLSFGTSDQGFSRRIIPRLNRYSFLSSPFQSIIHQITYHPTLYNIDTNNSVKQTAQSIPFLLISQLLISI